MDSRGAAAVGLGEKACGLACRFPLPGLGPQLRLCLIGVLLFKPNDKSLASLGGFIREDPMALSIVIPPRHEPSSMLSFQMVEIGYISVYPKSLSRRYRQHLRKALAFHVYEGDRPDGVLTALCYDDLVREYADRSL